MFGFCVFGRKKEERLVRDVYNPVAQAGACGGPGADIAW
jgi:hypothetical protein